MYSLNAILSWSHVRVGHTYPMYYSVFSVLACRIHVDIVIMSLHHRLKFRTSIVRMQITLCDHSQIYLLDSPSLIMTGLPIHSDDLCFQPSEILFASYLLLLFLIHLWNGANYVYHKIKDWHELDLLWLYLLYESSYWVI